MSGGTKFPSEYCPGGHVKGGRPTLGHWFHVVTYTMVCGTWYAMAMGRELPHLAPTCVL